MGIRTESANQKKIGSENSQSATFAESPKICHIIYVRKLADLLFADLIYGPPTFVYYRTRLNGLTEEVAETSNST